MCIKQNKQKNEGNNTINNEYFSDSPISINDKNDQLGTEKIVKQIESIVEVVDVSEESYVLGLQGVWGSGKSSILKSINLKEDKYIIFNYSPWIYGNEVNLYEKFFDELVNILGSSKHCSDKSIKKDFLEYKLKIVGSFTDKFNKSLIRLLKYIRNISLSGSVVYILYNLYKIYGTEINFIILFIIFVIGIFGVVYLFFLIKLIIDKIELWNYYKNYTTIDEVKKTIFKKLNKLNKKIIIIIDDIDRLKSDKISSIFQLVKSTANFNNIVYLLSYDKGVVSEALKNEYGADGYLDKFIQMEISLPKYPMFGLNNIFSDFINQFLQYVHKKYPDTNYSFSEKEKNELKHFMISPKCAELFRTMRNIKRYINMLKADFNILHQNRRVNEINILDLIFIEIIKFSDENFYNWIYETMGHAIHTRLFRGRYVEDLKTSVMKVINESYKGWEDVFIYLFPLTANGVDSSDPSRISSIYSFDIYFSLITPSFSNTKFYEILKYIKDKDKKYVLSYINDGDNVRNFLRKTQDVANNINYDSKDEKESFIKLLMFIINNEKNFKKYTEFLHDLDIDVGRCLFIFLDNLKTKPKEYKKYFMKIFHGCREYYQIISYVYNFLNTDYEHLYETEKNYIVDQIKHDHDLIGNKTVIQLQNIVHSKYVELLGNNKLHYMGDWCYTVKIAILLKWIKGKKIIYKYLKDNSLFSEFLVESVLKTTSNYFKGQVCDSDIKVYLSHAKLYFDKSQFNSAVNLFHGKKEDKKILKRVSEIWE